jgi:hypothetical protein
MLRKFSVIFFVFLLFLILSPSSLSNNITRNSNGFGFRSIFAADTLINIRYTTPEDAVTPNRGVIDIPLLTTFELTGPFVNFQKKLLRNYIMEINLSIEGKDEWCRASISNPLVKLGMRHTEPFHSTLSVTVTEDAPAFSQGVVSIKATSEDVYGFLFKRVNGAEVIFDVTFVVGYWPCLSASLENSTWKIPPRIVTEIPITLENLGNGPTHVAIEIEEIPKKWNITYPKSVQLGSGVYENANKKKDIVIQLIPPEIFSNERINMTINYYYIGMPELQGTPISFELTVQNDGSYNESGFYYNLLILVFLVLIIFFIIRFRKRRLLIKKSN